MGSSCSSLPSRTSFFRLGHCNRSLAPLLPHHTFVSTIIFQGPAFYYTSEGYTQAEVAAGEASFAGFGLVVCLLLFFGYIWYQVGLSPWANAGTKMM